MNDKMVFLVGGVLDGKRVILPENVRTYRATFRPHVLPSAIAPGNCDDTTCDVVTDVMTYNLYPTVLGVDTRIITLDIGVPAGDSPSKALHKIFDVYSIAAQQKAKAEHSPAKKDTH